MALIGERASDVHHAGETAGGVGSFICQGCSIPVSFEPAESIPRCPNCGGTDFRRASLFEQPTLRDFPVSRPAFRPAHWLDGVRESISEPGTRARLENADAGALHRLVANRPQPLGGNPAR